MLHIVIIGVGGIGSRHLQALAALDRPACIQVVDVSAQSIANATQLFMQGNPSPQLLLEHYDTIDPVAENIDIAIIATSSMVRRQIVFELLKSKTVKYMILEKVLFPQEEDYEAVRQLIEEKGSRTWVNCPRRMNTMYQDLREQLKNESNIDIHVTGGNWGLGCNALHFVDLIAFLTHSAAGFYMNTDGLDPEIIQSKRSGYIEFTGSLSGHSSGCGRFVLTSEKNSDTPVILTIRSSNLICVVKEFERKLYVFDGKEKWKLQETAYKGLYQSGLTNLVVESLADTGECLLTPYDESMALHLPMLRALLAFTNRQLGENKKLCPIT